MFRDCQALKTLDVSRFDTKNVVMMTGMFKNCNALTKLDVSGFNAKNTWDMVSMFAGCAKLESLDLSSFDVSRVMSDRYFKNIIKDCSSLREITAPRTMNDSKEAFFNSIAGSMVSGPWVDETSGKIYADKSDTMEDGHKYVQKDIEIVVKVTDIIKNNNLDYEVKTENDNSQLLTGIKLDTDAAQIKKNLVRI